MSMSFLQMSNDLIDEGIHFKSLPPNYVAWFLIPLAVIIYTWWFYKREKQGSRNLKIFLAALRVLSIFFVIALLFDPHRQFRRIEEIRSMVTILVDESASMAKKDNYEQDPEGGQKLATQANLPSSSSLRDSSRLDLAKRVLGPDGLDIIAKIKEKHEVKLRGFSTPRPHPLQRLSEATEEGAVTAMGDALAETLADPDIQIKPNTSVILISDGRSNTGTDVVDLATHAGRNDKIPIHTITVGDTNSARDLELRFIRADEVVLKGNTLNMELTVRNRGFGTQWVTVTIIDQNSIQWAPPQQKKIEDLETDQVISLNIRVDRPKGTYTLDVRIAGPAAEENKRNNVKKHTVTVKDDLLRVLYVETLPRWEYRRLKNFLVRGDEAFRANCLLLSAETDFVQEFTPAPGMKSIREFPKEFAALDEYDVLIFGDVDPSRLASTPVAVKAILENIRKFVDNGGGLAVICGEGWTPRAYADSPLDQLLPVDITVDSDGGGPMRNYVDEWKPKLSAVGRTHPIMQLRSDPEENRALWEDRNEGLMELRWWYPIRKASPAAQVLAYHPNERNRFGNFPLYVTGSYGDGPVFFSAVDETWRWFYMKGAFDFNRFWGNTIRFLSRAHLYRGSKRYKLISDASEYHQGETVHLTAFAKDKNFEKQRTKTQRVMIVPPEGKAKVVEFPLKSDGEYSWSFKPTKDGHYQAWIVGDEGLTGSRYALISFDVRYVDPERQDSAVDVETMKEIARASGGAHFILADAADVLNRLKSDTTRRSSITTVPLREKPWLPLILILLMTTEWLIRKRTNMA